MSRITTKLETHAYIVGEITPLASSTPYKPLKTMYLKGYKVTLDQAPEGASFTTVKLIRNFDPLDVIYQVNFEAGDQEVTNTTEATLTAGDTMSLIVSSVCANYGGADLIFSINYHN